MRHIDAIAAASAMMLAGATATIAFAQERDPQAQEESMEEQAPTESFADPERFVYRDGEALYRAVCQGCHMPDGQGAVGAAAYPALADNPMLEDSAYPAYVVIHGQRAMPAFGSYLDDEQIAALVDFIRTSFGNDFEASTTAEDVATYR